MNNEIIIYQTEDNEVAVRLDSAHETLWLSQKQMSELFATSTDNIGLHLKNIYRDGELDELSTTEESSVVRQEGDRQVKRTLKHYDLNAIISVGYRVNSKKGTQFRIWATQRLREYLVQGYAINQQRFDSNAAELKQAISLIRKAAKSPELTAESGSGLVEIVSRYTQTFLWLQQYDEGLLSEPKGEDGVYCLLLIRRWCYLMR
ncbi:hypothetical protein bplSymb_SCF00710P002 [Bathymodiolus platifrons methanotrophic gill symbiont]|nr:hypothetical protein bplSymb_SCF00710P002 [Bathymodiolus platifrons methanotrophic gill symbiont]